MGLRSDSYFTAARERIRDAHFLHNNDYRFRSEAELRAYLKKLGRNRGIKGDFLKFNSEEIFRAAAEIIRLGAGLWISLERK